MQIQNIDHIVILVGDISKTKQFYSVFLGDPFSEDVESVVFNVGKTQLFFATPYKDGAQGDKDMIGFNHLAFSVETIEELRKWEEKLTKAKIKHSGVKDDPYGGKGFIWLDDPDSIRIELYVR